MTRLQYWLGWLLALIVALITTRIFLVQPIVDAIRGLKVR